MFDNLSGPSAKPSEILSDYYKANGFDQDGGFSSKVVAIKFGRFLTLYLSNFDARRLAIRKHDLHHIVTGYTPSTLLGESEIGTWEIVAGTKTYWAALLLDGSAVLLGFMMSPSKIFRAFVQGRRTKTLYYDFISDEEATETPINELQKLLCLDQFGKSPTSNSLDLTLFTVFMLIASIYALTSLLFMPFVLVFSIVYSVILPRLDKV